MENFDKRMALDVLEDTLTDMETPHGCGVAVGLCSAFYLCGLLNTKEWQTFLQRIPVDPGKVRASEISRKTLHKTVRPEPVEDQPDEGRTADLFSSPLEPKTRKQWFADGFLN